MWEQRQQAPALLLMSKVEQKLGHVSLTHTKGLVLSFCWKSKATESLVSRGEGSRQRTGETG